MQSFRNLSSTRIFYSNRRRQATCMTKNVHKAQSSQREPTKSVFCIRIRNSIQMISGIQIWICTWQADPEMPTVQTQHFSNMTTKADFGGQEASCGTGDKIGCPKPKYTVAFQRYFERWFFTCKTKYGAEYGTAYRKRTSFLWTPSDSDFSTITNMQCRGPELFSPCPNPTF